MIENYGITEISERYKVYKGVGGFGFGTGMIYIALRHNMVLEKTNYSYRNVFRRMISTSLNRRATFGFGIGGALLGYAFY